MGNLLYLKNEEIDRQKWDECIENSPQGVVYALSWYLDFCENEWEAVVEIESEKYLTVMPVQLVKRYGFKYVYQHPYSFELGVFSIKKNFNRPEFLNCVNTAFGKYSYIAKYRFNSNNTCFFLETEIQQKHTVHHLNLGQPYESIKKKYSKDRIKNIKRAQKNEQFVSLSDDYTSLVDMFNKFTIPKIPTLKYRPEINLSLLEMANKLGFAELYFVCDKSGDKLAGGVFFKFKDKLINISNSATTKGRRYSSMTMLIDHVIQKYANTTYTVLDFGGSDDAGVAHFKEGFGSVPLIFNEVQISKFPSWINGINAFRRKLVKMYLTS